MVGLKIENSARQLIGRRTIVPTLGDEPSVCFVHCSAPAPHFWQVLQPYCPVGLEVTRQDRRFAACEIAKCDGALQSCNASRAAKAWNRLCAPIIRAENGRWRGRL